MAEVLNRMAHILTVAEAHRQAQRLRLPPEPAGEGDGRRIVLTPHPAEDELLVDHDGRFAHPVGADARAGSWEENGIPLEGPWECERCRRLVSSAWKVHSLEIETGVDGVNYVCKACVRSVGG